MTMPVFIQLHPGPKCFDGGVCPCVIAGTHFAEQLIRRRHGAFVQPMAQLWDTGANAPVTNVCVLEEAAEKGIYFRQP